LAVHGEKPVGDAVQHFEQRLIGGVGGFLHNVLVASFRQGGSAIPVPENNEEQPCESGLLKNIMLKIFRSVLPEALFRCKYLSDSLAWFIFSNRPHGLHNRP
ncbi:MAG TPA: hypothetical protein VFL47_15485, partial [Flavisolibacter sp.]|nr:hypothetical protein [Flavisolibacter sp.]